MTRHCSECGVSEDDLGFGDSFNEAVSSDGKALAYCGGCWRAVVDRREWEQRGRALKVDRLVVAIEHLFDHEHGLEPYGDADRIVQLLRAAGHDEWLRFQRAADIKRKEPPSVVTRALVIARFESRRDCDGASEAAE